MDRCKKVNRNSKLKKGHNFVKIQNRVISSCLKVGLVVTKKYLKFQNNNSKGIGNKWGGTKNLHQNSMSKKGYNFVKIQSYVLMPGSGVDGH